MKNIEYSSNKPNKSKLHLTQRGRAVAGLAVVSGLALAGTYIKGRVNENSARNRLPACDVPESYGDTVSGLAEEISDNGSGVRISEASIIAPDGHVRRRDTDPVTSDGSITIQPGDSIEFPHVQPGVCYKVGGHVIGFTQPEQANEPIKK